MSTAVATRPAHTVRTLLANESVRSKVAQALPHFFKPEQFMVIVQTQINKNPKLEECTPESFMIALLSAAQMGIPVDGRCGHLIPRKSRDGVMECQFQADYKGLVRLVRNNGDVSDIYAVLVHEKDTFRLTQGLHRDLIHEPNVFIDRGAIIGAYAVIVYKDGSTGFEFMARREIEVIRDKSDGYRAYKAGYVKSSTWVTDEGEMFKKTVIKRLLKLADLSPDTADRVAVDVETAPSRVEVQVERAHVPDPAQLPAPSSEAEASTDPAAQELPKRRVRQAKAQEVPPADPAPTESPADAPAPQSSAPTGPGAEEAVPAPEGPKSQADTVRAICQGYTDTQILRVLTANMLAEPSMSKLEQVAPSKLARALDDPDNLRLLISEHYGQPNND